MLIKLLINLWMENTKQKGLKPLSCAITIPALSKSNNVILAVFIQHAMKSTQSNFSACLWVLFRFIYWWLVIDCCCFYNCVSMPKVILWKKGQTCCCRCSCCFSCWWWWYWWWMAMVIMMIHHGQNKVRPVFVVVVVFHGGGAGQGLQILWSAWVIHSSITWHLSWYHH